MKTTLIAVLAALVLAFGAVAADDQKAETAKKAQPQAPQAPQPGPGMVVTKDPDTGQLRAPTAEEFQALTQKGNRLLRTTAPQIISGPGKAVGLKLDATMDVYSVVTKGSDGKLVMDCVTGEKAANDAVTKGARTSSKEGSDEK